MLLKELAARADSRDQCLEGLGLALAELEDFFLFNMLGDIGSMLGDLISGRLGDMLGCLWSARVAVEAVWEWTHVRIIVNVNGGAIGIDLHICGINGVADIGYVIHLCKHRPCAARIAAPLQAVPPAINSEDVPPETSTHSSTAVSKIPLSDDTITSVKCDSGIEVGHCACT